MKVTALRAESFKRISVVDMTFGPDDNLVQITGANANGKTSFLDAVMAALGGGAAVPDQPIAKGKTKARIVVKLDGGKETELTVERRMTAKNPIGTITVTDANGRKWSSPESMLKALMGAIGFDPLAFMRLKPAEKADLLRSIVKFDVDLDALDKDRASVFEKRTDLNRAIKQAEARAAAITVPDDLPDEAPDVAALLGEMRDVSDYNANIETQRVNRAGVVVRRDNELREATRLEGEIAEIEERLADARARLESTNATAAKLTEEINGWEGLPEQKKAGEIETKINEARGIEAGIELRTAKETAEAEVTTLTRERDELSEDIDHIDAIKELALRDAKMPLEGLSFDNGVVTYNGIPLDQASGAEQLRISAAIGAALNPKLRVMLARDGSLLDKASLKLLADFAEANDMQIFLERVDESGEVGIVMEDGHVKGQEQLVADFEKAEAAKPEDGPEEPKADVDETKDDAYPAAKAFLETKTAELQELVKLPEIDKLNVSVKRSLKRFPGLTGTWNTAYLERVRLAGTMKTNKDKAKA